MSEARPISLAVIGTAGRNEDGPRLAAEADLMVRRMLDAVRKTAELTGATELVSGGAAWADHVAVMAFLAEPDRFTLRLELPVPTRPRAGRGVDYEDTGIRNFRTNPGGTLNFYFHPFARAMAKIGRPSPYEELAQAVSHPRATVRVWSAERGLDALHVRNAKVAEADHVIASTYGAGRILKDGGTADTLTHFLKRPGHGKAFHLELNALKLFPGAEPPDWTPQVSSAQPELFP